MRVERRGWLSSGKLSANHHIWMNICSPLRLTVALSAKLRENKLHAKGGKPDTIVAANIGCQTHLTSASRVPVHIKFVEESLSERRRSVKPTSSVTRRAVGLHEDNKE